MNNLLGVYKHIRTGMLYQVIGLARKVEDPKSQVVVYKQLYNSKLRGDLHIDLPRDTLWTRDFKDFFCQNPTKFEKVKTDEPNK